MINPLGCTIMGVLMKTLHQLLIDRMPEGGLLAKGGLPARGASLLGGPPCQGGLLARGSPCRGGSPCRRSPPVDRITDTSKNITLATTSLRPVKITRQHSSRMRTARSSAVPVLVATNRCQY